LPFGTRWWRRLKRVVQPRDGAFLRLGGAEPDAHGWPQTATSLALEARRTVACAGAGLAWAWVQGDTRPGVLGRFNAATTPCRTERAIAQLAVLREVAVRLAVAPGRTGTVDLLATVVPPDLPAPAAT